MPQQAFSILHLDPKIDKIRPLHNHVFSPFVGLRHPVATTPLKKTSTFYLLGDVVGRFGGGFGDVWQIFGDAVGIWL